MVPEDPRLKHGDIELGAGQIVVPLALVQKGPLTAFSICGPDGASVPLLGAEANERILAGAIFELYKESGPIPDEQRLMEALAVICSAKGSAQRAEHLVKTGVFDDQMVLCTPCKSLYAPEALELTVRAGAEFLLSAVLDESLAGTRCILKFTSSWDVTDRDQGKPKETFGRAFASAAVGLLFTDRPFALQLIGSSEARSFHVEFEVPARMHSSPLTFFLDGGDAAPTAIESIDSGPSEHYVHSSFSSRALMGTGRVFGQVSLGSRFDLLRWTALLSNLATSIIVWFILLLPGAPQVLSQSGASGAVALILAIPAVAIGLLAGQVENSFLKQVNVLPRVLTLFASALLLSVGFSFAGGLIEPYRHGLWSVSAVWSTLAVTMIVLGALVGRRRRRRATQSHVE